MGRCGSKNFHTLHRARQRPEPDAPGTRARPRDGTMAGGRALPPWPHLHAWQNDLCWPVGFTSRAAPILCRGTVWPWDPSFSPSNRPVATSSCRIVAALARAGTREPPVDRSIIDLLHADAAEVLRCLDARAWRLPRPCARPAAACVTSDRATNIVVRRHVTRDMRQICSMGKCYVLGWWEQLVRTRYAGRTAQGR
jgi:hypothetical protein